MLTTGEVLLNSWIKISIKKKLNVLSSVDKYRDESLCFIINVILPLNLVCPCVCVCLCVCVCELLMRDYWAYPYSTFMQDCIEDDFFSRYVTFWLLFLYGF